MANLISDLDTYVKEELGVDSFHIFIQNGISLLRHSKLSESISGLIQKNLWYKDGKPVDDENINKIKPRIDNLLSAGNLVFTLDYLEEKSLIKDAYEKSRMNGYIPYVTKKELDQLTINEGYEPD